MKKCQKCGYENGDSMNFCMECGTALENSGFGEQPTASYSSQPTASLPGTVPTNQPNSAEIQTVVSSRNMPPSSPTVVTNQPYKPPPTPFSTAPQISPPPPSPKKGGSKTFLIVGVLLALLVLGGIGVVAIGAIAYLSQKDDPYPTPTPISPTPNNSPLTTPTKVPLKTTPTESRNTSGADADYHDMWVDYNVKEGGKFGMRIHTSFSTKNMKNIDSYLAIYVQKDDGSPIYGNDSAFRSKTGQVAVFKLLRPAYDPARYDDVQLFIPYNAFSLSPGKYKLQLNAYLIYKDDALQAKGPIAHLNTYDFEFEQK